jgi:hypothetical protein
LAANIADHWLDIVFDARLAVGLQSLPARVAAPEAPTAAVEGDQAHLVRPSITFAALLAQNRRTVVQRINNSAHAVLMAKSCIALLMTLNETLDSVLTRIDMPVAAEVAAQNFLLGLQQLLRRGASGAQRRSVAHALASDPLSVEEFDGPLPDLGVAGTTEGRVLRLFAHGKLRAGLRVACNKDAVAAAAGHVDELSAKFPLPLAGSPVYLAPVCLAEPQRLLGSLTVEPDRILKFLKRSSRASGGCSGISPHHLLKAIEVNENVLFELTRLVNNLIRGIVPMSFIIDFLVVLLKPHGAGLRPILIGETLLRVASSACCEAIQPLVRQLDPGQFGVATPDGSSFVTYVVREWVASDPCRRAIKWDWTNAYNSIDRELFLRWLDLNAPAVASFYRAIFAGVSPIASDDGSTFSLSTGGQQGNPSMTALFAIAQGVIFGQYAPPLPDGVSRLSFVDDSYFLLTEAQLPDFCNWLHVMQSVAASFGLCPNVDKSVVFGHGRGPDLLIGDHLRIRHVDTSVSAVDILGIPFSTSRAVLVDAFRSSVVAKSQREVDALVAVGDPQLALLGLRYSVSRRLVYAARCTPPDILVEAARDFDVKLVSAICSLVALPSVPTSADLRGLLRLPFRLGGLGLPTTADLAPSCFVAGGFSCLRVGYPLVGRGPLMMAWISAIQHFFRCSPDELLDSFHAHRDSSTPPQRRPAGPPGLRVDPLPIISPIYNDMPPFPAANPAFALDFQSRDSARSIQAFLQGAFDRECQGRVTREYELFWRRSHPLLTVGLDAADHVKQTSVPLSYLALYALPAPPFRLTPNAVRGLVRIRLAASVHQQLGVNASMRKCGTCRQLLPASNPDLCLHALTCDGAKGARTERHQEVARCLVEVAKLRDPHVLREPRVFDYTNGVAVDDLRRPDFVRQCFDRGLIFYDCSMARTLSGISAASAISSREARKNARYLQLLTDAGHSFFPLVITALGYPSEQTSRFLSECLSDRLPSVRQWHLCRLSCVLARSNAEMLFRSFYGRTPLNDLLVGGRLV